MSKNKFSLKKGQMIKLAKWYMDSARHFESDIGIYTGFRKIVAFHNYGAGKEPKYAYKIIFQGVEMFRWVPEAAIGSVRVSVKSLTTDSSDGTVKETGKIDWYWKSL